MMPSTEDQSFEIVRTVAGSYRGVRAAGITAFKGMGYGEPTDRSGRFQPPRPPQPHQGVRDAFEWGNAAPQGLIARYPVLESWDTGFDAGPKSEDCLVLNVWTPGLGDDVRRPVMMFLHGGGFHGRSGSRGIYDGANLARHGDVVVVTINHRVNVFGYLSLKHLDERFADSGNAGTLDTILALRWINANIAAFGGDPANVTIFGQSGGGGKVNALLAAPAAKGLFHKAIVQSAVRIDGIEADRAAALTDGYLAAIGIGPGQLDRLQSMPWHELVDATGRAGSTPFSERVFGPTQDGRTIPGPTFAPVNSALSADIPLLIGNTRTETSMLLGSVDPGVFMINETELRRRLGALVLRDDLESIIAAFRATRPHATPAELLFAITTHWQFRKLSITEAELKHAQGAAPVFMYDVGWPTPVDDGKWGSPHSMEHGFVFRHFQNNETMYGAAGEAVYRLSEQMSTAWVQFARTGDPNCAPLPSWPPYDPARRATMVFDDPPRVVDDLRQEDRLALSGGAAENFVDVRVRPAAA